MRYTTRWVAARWVAAVGLLGLFVSLAAGFGGDAETTENPYYKHWASFKKGTTVVLIEKTTFGDDATDELPGGIDEKVVRYKLVSVSPKMVVVESVTLDREFLKTTESGPTKIFYPANVNKAHLAAVLLAAGAKPGEETLKVRVGREEKEIKCKTIAGTRKKKGEEVKGKFWFSADVPGGVVKRTRTTMRDGKLVAETTTLLLSYRLSE
jgi:hypothetical protein